MKRRLRLGMLFGFLVTLASCATAPGPNYDLVIRGGTLVDGSGAPAYVADVAVVGDRIVKIGQLDNATAAPHFPCVGINQSTAPTKPWYKATLRPFPNSPWDLLPLTEFAAVTKCLQWGS